MTSRETYNNNQVELRLRAVERLAGPRPPADARQNSAAALGVLYELAGSPSTSADALALLHELQVHQVELEMQEEELQRSRNELEASLARHIRLYDLAPFAYFTLDKDMRLHELNLAAARLLGADREALLGQALDSFLHPDSGKTLREMLARVGHTGLTQSCTVRFSDAPAQSPGLRVRAVADPNGGCFLLGIADTGA